MNGLRIATTPDELIELILKFYANNPGTFYTSGMLHDEFNLLFKDHGIYTEAIRKMKSKGLIKEGENRIITLEEEGDKAIEMGGWQAYKKLERDKEELKYRALKNSAKPFWKTVLHKLLENPIALVLGLFAIWGIYQTITKETTEIKSNKTNTQQQTPSTSNDSSQESQLPLDSAKHDTAGYFEGKAKQ